MTTTKSPKAIALVAYATALRALPLHRRKKSPKKFTQPQLVACLALKEFFNTDYRGIAAILADSSDLRDILELQQVPHYTTLQKASRRITKKKALDKLMHEILNLAVEAKILKKKSAHAGLDGTGFESHHVSSYFVKRKAKVRKEYQMMTYTRYPTAGILADSPTHLVLSGVPGRGPRPEITYFEQVVDEAAKHAAIEVLTADAAFDSEKSHVFARTKHGIRTIIPARIGRKTDKLPTGKYRKLMATRFNAKLYGQRWQVETVNSMIKRNLGSALRARSYWSQCREIMLRLFVHNVMVA
jgi:hypothetical protein